MANAAEKVRGAGNRHVMVCERGTMFGYHDLVMDARNLVWLREAACPVLPDGRIASGGLRDLVPTIARACVAVGVDGLFLEVHDDPDSAPVDGPTQWPIEKMQPLLEELMAIARVSKGRRMLDDSRLSGG
eukprot:SM000166S02453  [mRNA]  locus=s166:8757:10333:+ [translate_table: standard]